MAVVDVSHRSGAVIGDPAHRVAAEAKPGDPRQAGTPQVVRRGALDLEVGDELLQQAPDSLPLARLASTRACAGSDSHTR